MEIKHDLAELEQQSMEVVQEEDKPKLNPVKWNYKPPILLTDGSLLIEPQFGDIDEKKKDLSSSEIERITRNKRIATLKNAEIPKLLYEPGELTKEEEKLIQVFTSLFMSFELKRAMLPKYSVVLHANIIDSITDSYIISVYMLAGQMARRFFPVCSWTRPFSRQISNCGDGLTN